MNTGKTLFAQIMEFAPHPAFAECVERYQGDHKIKSFTCWDQFLCQAFAQLTYRESLRDIEACLRVERSKLYHMGIRGRVSRNTLAHANKTRDWRIYADFAQVLIRQAQLLYASESFGLELDNAVYALDSTTIDLCLSLFPWALFRQHKGAVKLHTLLDLRSNIPTVCVITPGNVHDVNILDQLVPEAGAIYIIDRAYMDFARLHKLHQASAFFVTRAKGNLKCRRLYSRPVDKTTGLRCDQIIVLKGIYSRQGYPDKLRRIRYYDNKQRKLLTFITNNFILSAQMIADLYRCRWQIETFFRWIKLNLRIKSFYGTTINAVKTQIWIAIAVYVLIAIIKKKLQLKPKLYTILQILSVHIFAKVGILQALSFNEKQPEQIPNANQLLLF